ncbi:MAG: hypothetical protein WC693_02485 [Patescibacteria group bacterium]
MNKRRGIILLITFLSILAIGIAIPMIKGINATDNQISQNCISQSRLLIPKLFKLITLYQKIEIQDDGNVIATTHSIFDVWLQRIRYSTEEDCAFGEGAHIEYNASSKDFCWEEDDFVEDTARLLQEYYHDNGYFPATHPDTINADDNETGQTLLKDIDKKYGVYFFDGMSEEIFVYFNSNCKLQVMPDMYNVYPRFNN